MQESIRAIQNETEAYFKRMNTVMQWTNEKLDALAGVQQVLKQSFADAHSLLSFTLKIIVAYLITAIPGVGIQRGEWEIWIEGESEGEKETMLEEDRWIENKLKTKLT